MIRDIRFRWECGWAEIGTAILDPKDAAKRDRPLADDLVVDGEPGMVEGLEHLRRSATLSLASTT